MMNLWTKYKRFENLLIKKEEELLWQWNYLKKEHMYSLMADYWVLNRKLLSIDAENLMQDDFWEYATKELEAFYQKYKTNYAKNQALGLLKELEERYKIVKEKLKETEKMEKEEKIETSLPWASAQA